ncbi:MAG: cysteine desulfurase [Firmicutes bacterium]|nr:cysteine desulfurase [Bacillota bacterium]
MKTIYFDNSATTCVSAAAAEAAMQVMREDFGNPSSLHGMGLKAARRLREARETLAGLLQVKAEELYFTSCGSESNNMLIMGVAEARRSGRIIVSAIEHAAVQEPARYLLQRGFEVCYAPVDARGVVDVDKLCELLTPDTVLVSIMQVNNEVGSIQPLTEIGAAVKRLAPQAIFHIDGVQGFGKRPVELARWQADAYSISAHKIHGPKGVGLLWLKQGVRIPPLIRGGGQEHGQRSGTENLPGIVAFATAAAEGCRNMAANTAAMLQVKQALYEQLITIEDAVLNGPDVAEGAAHILNMSFPGVRSEVLLHCLEAQGICVSSGSACSSHKSSGSGVLAAMGAGEERADSALRFSFCAENTVEEAAVVAAAVKAAVSDLRMMQKGKGKRRR